MVTRILTDPAFYLASIEGSGVFRTTNGGTSWSPVPSVPTGPSYGPFQRLGTDLYLSADGLGAYKSVDNGVTWTPHTVNGVARRRTGPIAHPTQANTLYFHTGRRLQEHGSGTSGQTSSGWRRFMHAINTDPSDPISSLPRRHRLQEHTADVVGGVQYRYQRSYRRQPGAYRANAAA